MEKNISFLKSLDSTKFIHAANYVAKFEKYDKLPDAQKKAFVSLPKSRPFKVREKSFNFNKQNDEKIKIYRNTDCLDIEAV